MDTGCGHSTDKFDQQELGGFFFHYCFLQMALKAIYRGQRALIN